MRSSWSVFAIACLVALPVCGWDQGTIEETDDPKDPHRALREAVEDIRTHYVPFASASRDFEYQSGLSRPGLGIILRGGFYFPRDEAAPGAEILAVTPGSPADEAGLQPGDLVVAWNGESLVKGGKEPQQTAAEASRKLVSRSRELKEGESVTLRYLRDEKEFEVTLVARQVDFSSGPAPDSAWRSDRDLGGAPGVVWRSVKPWFLSRGWLDMELVEINPGLGEYFGADTGVLVVRGPAEDEILGLASGDVILRIGDREVKNPEHAMRILRSYEPNEELSIDIIRRGRAETLTGKVPESSFGFDYQFRRSGERE